MNTYATNPPGRGRPVGHPPRALRGGRRALRGIRTQSRRPRHRPHRHVRTVCASAAGWGLWYGFHRSPVPAVRDMGDYWACRVDRHDPLPASAVRPVVVGPAGQRLVQRPRLLGQSHLRSGDRLRHRAVGGASKRPRHDARVGIPARRDVFLRRVRQFAAIAADPYRPDCGPKKAAMESSSNIPRTDADCVHDQRVPLTSRCSSHAELVSGGLGEVGGPASNARRWTPPSG